MSVGVNTSFSDMTSALGDLFGTSSSVSTYGTGTSTSSVDNTGTTTQAYDISEEGVNEIIASVLGGADGLASIFAGEQSSGLYNSSTAAQAAGDLSASLVGEIAQLLATQTTTVDTNQTTNASSTSSEEAAQEEEGLLETIFGGLF